MDFLKKDFESLHMSRVRDTMVSDNLSNRFFFSAGSQTIFINTDNKHKVYKIYATPQTNLNELYRESVLNVVYVHKDFDKVVSQFLFYCELLIKRYNNGLY